MNKLLTILFLLFSLSGFSQVSPKTIYLSPDSTSQFGISLPIGTEIWEKTGKKLWILDAEASSTTTIQTATKTQINDEGILRLFADLPNSAYLTTSTKNAREIIFTADSGLQLKVIGNEVILKNLKRTLASLDEKSYNSLTDKPDFIDPADTVGFANRAWVIAQDSLAKQGLRGEMINHDSLVKSGLRTEYVNHDSLVKSNLRTEYVNHDSLDRQYTRTRDALKRNMNDHDSLSKLDERNYESLTDKPVLTIDSDMPYSTIMAFDSSEIIITTDSGLSLTISGKEIILKNTKRTLSNLDERSYNSLTDIPSTFAPSSHSHTQSDVTGLPDSLANIYTETQVNALLGAKQNVSDTSTKDATRYWVGQQGYLTGNQNITLSGDVSGSGTTAITATVADDSHNHIISNVDALQDSLNDRYRRKDTADVLLSRLRAGHDYSVIGHNHLGTYLEGIGSANYIPRFNATKTLESARIYDNPANNYVQVDTALRIDGTLRIENNYILSNTTGTAGQVLGLSSPLPGTYPQVVSFRTINHDGLPDYNDLKHFYQKSIDTINTSLSGLVKATSGKLSTITDNSSNWDAAYGWGNHANAGYITDGNTNWNNIYGFITGESDPIFSISPSFGITSGNISTWNALVSFPGFGTSHSTAAYGDHNHSGVYLTSESDPVFSSSPAFGITSGNISSWSGKMDYFDLYLNSLSYTRFYNKSKINFINGWGTNISFDIGTYINYTFSADSSKVATQYDLTPGNTAYGWGNHASEGYLKSEVDGSITNEGDLSFADSSGVILIKSNTSKNRVRLYSGTNMSIGIMGSTNNERYIDVSCTAVPYTGATTDVNLGTKDLTAKEITVSDTLRIGSGGSIMYEPETVGNQIYTTTSHFKVKGRVTGTWFDGDSLKITGKTVEFNKVGAASSFDSIYVKDISSNKLKAAHKNTLESGYWIWDDANILYPSDTTWSLGVGVAGTVSQTIITNEDITAPNFMITKDGGYAVKMVAGCDLEQGDVVRMGWANGTVTKTTSVADSIYENNAVGVAYNTASAGQSVWVVTSGKALVKFTSTYECEDAGVTCSWAKRGYLAAIGYQTCYDGETTHVIGGTGKAVSVRAGHGVQTIGIITETKAYGESAYVILSINNNIAL